MCDTLVALGNATADGVTVFGKNSDREPNEAQHLLRIPAARHSAGSQVRCTYIGIPQVEQTYEVLISKPFWIWGGEMGTNEHGVTIGNEAVFTKVPYDKKPGLIGMDFLRLALERAQTAREALDVITGLLTQYGQGGNCGFQHKTYYHNSFLIADPNSAWVLETAGQQWAAEQVKDVRSISNGITIGTEWDLAAPDLVAFAVDHKWCKGRNDFHFGRCYSDPLYTRFSRSRERQCRTTAMLMQHKGSITVETVMRALRDHGPDAGPDWTPARGLFGFTVCAHASLGPIRSTQTTGSLVSHLSLITPTHYVTATAAPCTSIFKPVWLGVDLPDTGPTPEGTYNEATLFWRHERLHRTMLMDYAKRAPAYWGERDALQAHFVEGACAVTGRPLAERAAYSSRAFAEADEAETRWNKRVNELPVSVVPGWLYKLAWAGFNRAAQMPSL